MPTRLFLVRHGATTLSAEDRFAGSADVPLSDEGREQARALGRRLDGVPIAAAYVSPMARTRETLRLILGDRNVEVVPRPELRETDHGHWETKTREDVRTEFPAEYARWERDPFTFAPSGGETGLQVLARALPVVLDIAGRHEGAAALIVSHKATLRLAIGSLLGVDLPGYRDKLDMSPCGLSVVDVKSGAEARLVLYNDVSHYATLPGPTGKRLSPWWA
ncbi:MAG TPA: histidine phosphatase family protein [Candidatus Polarisedimenticolaceae bacterium]|nr:histidine phosphatase family protein [Candidatus Polarisedimenticolaceae bacterium]